MHLPGCGPDQRRTFRPGATLEPPDGDARRAAVHRVSGGLDAATARPDEAVGPRRGVAAPGRLGRSRGCPVQGGPRPGEGDRPAGSQAARQRLGAGRPQLQLLAGNDGDGPRRPVRRRDSRRAARRQRRDRRGPPVLQREHLLRRTEVGVQPPARRVPRDDGHLLQGRRVQDRQGDRDERQGPIRRGDGDLRRRAQGLPRLGLGRL